MSTAPGPSHIRDLIERADAYAAAGDVRAAVSFYQAALVNARDTRPADPKVIDELRRGQGYVQKCARDFQRALRRSLDGIETADEIARVRLAHSLEMATGERTIYPQQPSVFYYPYLAQRQFFERDEFGWVAELEAAAPAIRKELAALVSDGADFRPYIEDEPNRPERDFHGLTNDPSWTALYLWNDGALVEENAARCPRTVEALQRVPMSHIGARTPSAMFSRLEPGAHIPPHAGMLNSRLICHLPLIVPAGCWLRVGNETREWEQGKLLIFDDSIEHEARNPSGELRIILLFDIWRPELSEPERQGISSIFETIDRYTTLPDA